MCLLFNDDDDYVNVIYGLQKSTSAKNPCRKSAGKEGTRKVSEVQWPFVAFLFCQEAQKA